MSMIINIPISSNDPLRTVRLRGLSIDGASTITFSPTGRQIDRAIDIQAAAVVYIEDCIVENVNQAAIFDRRTSGQTKLFIRDSYIGGNGGPGIVMAAQNVGVAVLDNVRLENNAYGIAVAAGNNVVINRSVLSGNSTAGAEADSGAQVTINNSTISHNNFGIQSGGSVRVSNNDIAFNNAAFSGQAATMGLNRYSGNVSIGTTPTPVPGAPSDIGP